MCNLEKMVLNKGQIKNSQILVKPSTKLQSFIKEIKDLDTTTPAGIKNLVLKNKPKEELSQTPKQPKLDYLINDKDQHFIKSLELKHNDTDCVAPFPPSKDSDTKTENSQLLGLQDLHWLYSHIQTENGKLGSKVYLHELLEGSEIVLPKNEEIPRNAELEKRCQKLRAEQQNREYQNMTKNVDGFRRKLPEDTIAYQLKMMNSHLIAVFQFIASVLAGFAFGFIGVELLFGNMDFASRLLLGIICALVIAIAELYFLAKKLNQDLEFENKAKQNWTPETKKTK